MGYTDRNLSNIFDGFDTKNIGYFTKQSEDKLLVTLHIENIKKIKPKFRKDILGMVEDDLFQQDIGKGHRQTLYRNRRKVEHCSS